MKIKRIFTTDLSYVVTIIVLMVSSNLLAQNTNNSASDELSNICKNLSKEDITKINDLIEAGADVNVAVDDTVGEVGGWNPLIIATSKGYIEIVKLLINSNADVNTTLTNGTTSLLVAIQQGNIEIINLLLNANANVNAATDRGVTPLYIAVQEGNVEAAKILLEANADVNATVDSGGHSPLGVAATKGFVEIVQLLINSNANVNAAKDDGTTPLYSASQRGHIEIVKLLIIENADVNINRNNDWSPLMIAINKGYLDVAKTLLLANANVNANASGWNPLMIATYKGYIEIVQQLIDLDANVNQDNGITALHFAAENGNIKIVKILINANADVNLLSSDGRSALTISKNNGYKDVGKLLIKNGIKEDIGISYQPNDKITFIQQALIEIGYSPGEEDGIMNDQTRKTVETFQNDFHNESKKEVSNDLIEQLLWKLGKCVYNPESSNRSVTCKECETLLNGDQDGIIGWTLKCMSGEFNIPKEIHSWIIK